MSPRAVLIFNQRNEPKKAEGRGPRPDRLARGSQPDRSEEKVQPTRVDELLPSLLELRVALQHKLDLKEELEKKPLSELEKSSLLSPNTV